MSKQLNPYAVKAVLMSSGERLPFDYCKLNPQANVSDAVEAFFKRLMQNSKFK